MKYNNQIIQTQFNQGDALKFLFFWGHQPNKDGSVGKGCFSQWWESEFVLDKVTYKSAEHYMMAEKARLFGDIETSNKILQAKHPHDAKLLGREVKNFNSKVWDDHKFSIVMKGNYFKFSQDEELKSFLLSTKKRVLVEASPRDFIWGVGMSQDDEGVNNPNLWKGQNLLGYALMEVRDQLSGN
jgi:ribA/ribD-fused uncharacterized protein